jgi:hypothetical protein
MAAVTATKNADGSITTDDGQATLNWSLGIDPNGSGRPQVLVAPPGQTPANIMECEQISGGRAAALLKNVGGTPWVLSQPTMQQPLVALSGTIGWGG